MVHLTEITQASLPDYRIAIEGKFYLFMPLYLEIKIDQPHLARQAVVTAYRRVQTVFDAGGPGPTA